MGDIAWGVCWGLIMVPFVLAFLIVFGIVAFLGLCWLEVAILDYFM